MSYMLLYSERFGHVSFLLKNLLLGVRKEVNFYQARMSSLQKAYSRCQIHGELFKVCQLNERDCRGCAEIKVKIKFQMRSA